MHLLVKVLCTLCVLLMIQKTDCLPQYSIFSIPWCKNKEEPSKFAWSFRVQDQVTFSPLYGINTINKQQEKAKGNNEVVTSNEKIKTVTPTSYYVNNFGNLYPWPIRTQDLRVWATYAEKKNAVEDPHDNKNFENTSKSNQNEDKQEFKSYFKDADLNNIFKNNDVTTESTTEFESTTFDDSFDLSDRVGHGHVVATLLG